MRSFDVVALLANWKGEGMRKALRWIILSWWAAFITLCLHTRHVDTDHYTLFDNILMAYVMFVMMCIPVAGIVIVMATVCCFLTTDENQSDQSTTIDDVR